MNTIKDYLEGLFNQLPKTAEIQRIKEELLINMEEKFDELIAEGKSNNEAIGTVIAEFGNIDELIESFGNSEESVIQLVEPVEIKTKKGRIVSLDEVKNYFAMNHKVTRLVAIGVVICLIGVSFLIFVSDNLTFGDNNATYGVIGLLLFVMIAVALFIYSNSIKEQNSLGTEGFKLTTTVRTYIEQYELEKKKQQTVPIIIGVSLCLIAVIFIILSSTREDDLMIKVVSLALLIIALATYLFITSSGWKTAVDYLLEREEFSQQGKKSTNTVDKIASFWWPLTIAIYFGYSFITKDWGRSWVIWPVSGILFGGIAAFFSSGNED